MFFWLWISLQTLSMEPLKLEELGTFQSLELQLYKFDDRFLALVSNEPQLTLFDKNGTILAVYNKRGHGAEDLHVPRFLGATANRLFILSDFKRLLIFDTKLKLLASKESGLPPTLNQGMLFGHHLAGDHFLLYAFQHSKHLLHKLRFNGNFQVKGHFYSQESDLQTHGTYQWLHKNRHFVADMIPRHSDSYMIQVREIIKGHQTEGHPILTELVAPVHDFPTRDVREPVILSEMAVTNQGFVVELAVVMPRGSGSSPDLNSLDFYWDYYNERGTNTKREQVGEKRLKPVRNSKEIFIVESGKDDIDFIRPFSLPALTE